MDFDGDLRTMLKEKAIKIMESRLMEQMMAISKTDRILLKSFRFDGKRKDYLNLPFDDAKIIFMIRTRMLLTKDNFPGRWAGVNCNVCGRLDTDPHLFSCPGYSDLINDNMSYDMFILLNVSLETLRSGAIRMRMVNERLKVLQDVAK